MTRTVQIQFPYTIELRGVDGRWYPTGFLFRTLADAQEAARRYHSTRRIVAYTL